jgi:hypothetical protein
MQDQKQALDFAHSTILLGPVRDGVCLGPDWFSLAVSFAKAIIEGYKTMFSLSPDVHLQLTQSPWFQQANTDLLTSFAQTVTCLQSHEAAFEQHLTHWCTQMLAANCHTLKPGLDAELDQWHEKHIVELTANATPEVEKLASLRNAQCCSRAKTCGKPAPFPTPHRQSSTLSKRNLTEASGKGSDADLSDNMSVASAPLADISRTPCANRTNQPALSFLPHPLHPSPVQPPIPLTQTDSLLAGIGDLIDKRLGPVLHCLNALESGRTTKGPSPPACPLAPAPLSKTLPAPPPFPCPATSPFHQGHVLKKERQHLSLHNSGSLSSPTSAYPLAHSYPKTLGHSPPPCPQMHRNHSLVPCTPL